MVKRKPKKKTSKQKPRVKNKISVKRNKIVTPKLNREEEVINQSGLSPGALEMEEILKKNGELFVPYDMEEEVVAKPKNKADVEKFMRRLTNTYGLPLAAEHAIATRDERRLSISQTPIGDFEEYISDKERMTRNDNNWRNYLNMTTGSTMPTSKTSKGGKRKSRRRRKKSRRRKKAKRKSRRRRK